VDAILQELPAVGIQLQAKNRDFWDTYDRQGSEAQFRFGITPPLALIIVLLAQQSGQFWWLLLLVVPLALLLQGVSQSVSASSTLVQAVVLKMVKPPVLERMDEEIARAVEKRRDLGPRRTH
jgi:ABC-type nickel/cobalt efflux system permease component RcnA